MKTYRTFIIFDTTNGRPDPASVEPAVFAGRLNHENGESCGIVYGSGISEAAGWFAAETGLDIIALECDGLRLPDPNLLAEALSPLIEKYNPENICFTHTPGNSAAASMLAVRLQCSCITAVEGVTRDNEGAVFTRSVFNGKALQSVRPLCGTKIFTVIQGAFPAPEEKHPPRKKGDIIIIHFTALQSNVMALDITEVPESEVKIEEADVIVAAGRGMGSEENFKFVDELAGLFKNGAAAGSRPVCDAGWMPYSRQVGATGKTVAPRLYIALGVSGSQQHMAGMKGAQCVVSINTDPGAAIFSVSDYIIVEDAVNFVHELIKAWQRFKKPDF